MEGKNINICSDCIQYHLMGCSRERLSKSDLTDDIKSCRKKIYSAKIDEQNWIYRASDDEKNRYILGIAGERPLICFGINPSTAEPGNTDPTIRSVTRIAKHNGYDSWIMMNIYPQRATDPDNIDINIDLELLNKNLFYISEILELYKPDELWAAWGNLINKRDFLMKCLERISNVAKQNNCNWITFGEINKSGHPRHPLYLKTSAEKHRYLHDYDKTKLQIYPSK
ncbi:MAG TPA: DUF1643 domain-containing protein [Anaerovoracaceae bacterium]|nr:DUF1643 domain-containing protein [Anaerovoracaceae bacterium]